MNFASDNTTGASPEVLAALGAGNDGRLMPYGNDQVTAGVEARLAEVFETEVAVILVATGSAANALALSVLTPPWGAVFCHDQSHVNEDECNAPEFYTSGAKLIVVDGPHAKIDPQALSSIATRGAGDVHMAQPSAVTVTQVTELGAVYTADEVAALGDICKAHSLRLHMDGARFANAMATLNCSPADATWRAGVDVLSFGATKNGALCAEAIVLFDPALRGELEFRRKRGGHLFSKMRTLALQMEAYLDDDLWLRNAAQANAMAARLEAGLNAISGVEWPHPRDANMLFPKLPQTVIDGLKADGFKFYDDRWAPGVCRLVCAFTTTEEMVDEFIAAAGKHAAAAA